MRKMTPAATLVLTLLLGVSSFFSMAQADMPKRVAKPLSVLFKTTAYGTASGAVFGVGIAALSGGGPKTFGKVTSLGMYAGILVGMYILLAPPEMIYNSSDEIQGGGESSGAGDNQDQGQTTPFSSPSSVAGPRENPALWIPVVTSHF